MKVLNDLDVFHVLFTRFNVPSGGKEKKIRAGDEWLDNRFQLFDDYCFPSVLSQSRQDFKWLVFFDTETPTHYKGKVDCYRDKYENFIPVYVSEWDSEVINKAIISVLPKSASWLLTTRLDNDDAIHVDFMKELRTQKFSQNHFFNFKNGFTFNRGVGYKHQHYSNAFLSYVERVETNKNIVGVWKWQHTEVIKNFDVTQIDMECAWLQLIHGGNVSNKVRGNVMKADEWSKYYPSISMKEVRDLYGFSLFYDLYVKEPIRAMRDSSIELLKKISFK